jgi:hypothetical protein
MKLLLVKYLYFVLGFSGGASPRTLKEKRAISEIFSANENLTSILTDFSFIPGHLNTLTDVPTNVKIQSSPKRCHYFSCLQNS